MKVDITARNLTIDDKLKNYLETKLGLLEKYLPRKARGASTFTAILEDDTSGHEDNRFVCEVIIKAPGSNRMVSREGTINIYAAIDIVEAKLKAQLLKYKEKQTMEPRRSAMLGRWLGRRATVTADELGEETA